MVGKVMDTGECMCCGECCELCKTDESHHCTPKRNKILPFAMTWMELEGIMLSEISQSEKDN